MNSFCKDCINSKIPKSIKIKFNNSYSKTFMECPLNDEKVIGCLIKERMKIDWAKFCVWLADSKKLSAAEAIEMARLGFFLEKDKGKK